MSKVVAHNITRAGVDPQIDGLFCLLAAVVTRAHLDAQNRPYTGEGIDARDFLDDLGIKPLRVTKNGRLIAATPARHIAAGDD